MSTGTRKAKMVQMCSSLTLIWITASLQLVLGVDEVTVDFAKSDSYDFVHRRDIVVPHKLEGSRRRRDLSTKETDQAHSDIAAFVIPVFGTEYIVDIQLNKNLISNKFVEIYDDENGVQIQQKVNPEHCYYHGQVRGHDVSSVVFSTCDGLSGMFSVADETFHITPHDKQQGDDGGMQHVHVVYKESDIKEKPVRTCGHNTSSVFHDIEHKSLWPSSAQANRILSRKIRNTVPTYNQNKEERFIEVYIVNDHTTWQANPTLLQMRDRTIQVANAMDEFYKTINMRVILTGVENWSKENKMTVVTDESVTLDNFCAYKDKYILHENIDYDVAQLVTGVDLTGSVAGLGYVGTMCGKLSCAITENDANTAMVAQVMAHEMGHNLGMNHDDGRSCGTCGWAGGCIMSAVVASSPKAFTQCSVDDMTSNKMGCLNDHPTSSYTDPVCGNGIKETGEECDCGSQADCPTVDPCCEVTGCKLKSSSECGEGECCSGCQLKARGTVCRAATSECDIDDTCTGSSNVCPEDKFKTDGTECDSNSAYCYTGTCRSRLAQCKYLLGTNATVGVDYCYEAVNIRGDTYGHCGEKSDGTYIVCATENVQCGKLQCGHTDPGVVFPVVGTSKSGSVVSGQKLVNGQVVETYDCKAGSADFGKDVPDPGMVTAGTKCGTGRWCQNAQCVSFTAATCPTVSGQTCAGRGSCDYNGECVCTENYDPGTNCETTIDTATLLDCYSCADDDKCGLTPNATNANTVKCESNQHICSVVKLDRGQDAKPFYTRACVYKSDCTEQCYVTGSGFNQCTTCCSSGLCNTDGGDPTATTTANPGNNGSRNTPAAVFLFIHLILLMCMVCFLH